MIINKKKIPEAFLFIAVGSAAALIHLVSVAVLVEYGSITPILANIFAFLIAFCISYTGHAFLTFADRKKSHLKSLPRFFIIACCGFTINELSYFFLLNQFNLPYLPTLFVILITVAIITFFSAKHWAFLNIQH